MPPKMEDSESPPAAVLSEKFQKKIKEFWERELNESKNLVLKSKGKDSKHHISKKRIRNIMKADKDVWVRFLL
jgi:hypothetical protein